MGKKKIEFIERPVRVMCPFSGGTVFISDCRDCPDNKGMEINDEGKDIVKCSYDCQVGR